MKNSKNSNMIKRLNSTAPWRAHYERTPEQGKVVSSKHLAIREHTVKISVPWPTCLIKGLGSIIVSTNNQWVACSSLSIQTSIHVYCAGVVYAEVAWNEVNHKFSGVT